MSEHKFQLKVTNGLTAIEGEIKGVNSRLDTLNGTTAKNESKIRKMEDQLLIYQSRNNIRDKIKIWLYNNVAGVVATVLGAYIIYKLGI